MQQACSSSEPELSGDYYCKITNYGLRAAQTSQGKELLSTKALAPFRVDEVCFWFNSIIYDINLITVCPADDTEMILRAKGVRGHYWIGLHGARVDGRAGGLWDVRKRLQEGWYSVKLAGRWKTGGATGQWSS